MAAETLAEDKRHNQVVKRIWSVFWILSVITLVEVTLGITKPDYLEQHTFIYMHFLNWIFIALTIVKAYYITWAFMHMEHETSSLRRAVVWTVFFLGAYLIFILLTEGDYVFEVYKNGVTAWDF